MTFGFQAMNDKRVVQVSDKVSGYVCIYSGNVNGWFSFAGRKPTDILCFTHLSGGTGGISDWRYLPSMYASGTHRMVVFRLENLVQPVTDPFGMEVYDVNGKLTFTSSRYPLVFASTKTTYHSLIFQGADYSGPDSAVYVFTRCSYTNAVGVVRTGSFRVNYQISVPFQLYNEGGTYPNQLVDVSHIPLVYNKP